jgi:lipopolysaccharide biosynthesis glycosyltransferase
LAEANSRYHIVFCTGLDRDLRYLAVLVRSIARHFSEPESLSFHFLHFQLSPNELQRFCQSVEDLPCPPPNLYSVDDLLGARVHQPGFGYYAWLWFSEVISDSITQLLYLDCDMLCCRDLRPLWDIDFSGTYGAFVADPGSNRHDCARDLAEAAPKIGYKYKLTGPYFNTGFAFLDMSRWRTLELSQLVDKRLSKDYTAFRFHDQDILNLILDHQVIQVSPEWNLIESIALYEKWDFELYQHFSPEEYFSPRLRHYSGKMKPDGPNVRASEALEFYSYLDETDWRGWRSEDSKSLAHQIKSHLLDFHYIVVRGFKQKVLTSPWQRLAGVVRNAPYVLLLYPLLPLYRAFRRLTRE